jgi:hypothetical protein
MDEFSTLGDCFGHFTYLENSKLAKLTKTDSARVAGFFFLYYTKTRKNIPNGHKIYQTAIKYTKRQSYIPNGHPKFTQIWTFGLKTYYLATLILGVSKSSGHPGHFGPRLPSWRRRVVCWLPF